MPKRIEDAANQYSVLPEKESNDPPFQVQYAMELLAAYAKASGMPMAEVMQQMADGTFPFEQYQDQVDIPTPPSVGEIPGENGLLEQTVNDDPEQP